MGINIFLGEPPAKIKQFIIDHYTDWTKVPLHFTAEEAGAKLSFRVGAGTYETSTTGADDSWTPYTSGTEITLANIGDKVYFRATTDDPNNTCYNENYDVNSQFIIDSGKIAAKGNIQSLLGKSMTRMDVPAVCYHSMFYDCRALTQAPALPATRLVDYCYLSMFSYCTALKTASFPNLTRNKVETEVVENQTAFYNAASNIETTCSDGILVINSTSV